MSMSTGMAAMALLPPSISTTAAAFENRLSPSPTPTSRRGRRFPLISSFTPNGPLFHQLSSSDSVPVSPTTSTANLLKLKRKVICQAAGESSPPPPSDMAVVYQGIYGPWTVEDSDVQEVILYRSGLVTAAVSFVLASSAVLLPDDLALKDLIKSNLDIFYALGACGLGLSLFLIHIYVTPIKRTLQAFWAIGVFGSLATYFALAQPSGNSLVQYVVENPTYIWFVGPLFAALTGLVFKEGLCYGKLEAGILTFIIPLVLLGHLTGLMDDRVKVALLSVWMALFLVFAGRKFTQPIKDDIGDKSVFIFNALSEEEKTALIKKLKLENYQEYSK